MKRHALAVVAASLVLAGCAASEPVDPFERCVDVNLEYALAQDREEAVTVCEFISENEGMLGGPTFAETFASSASAKQYAEAELAKSR